VRLIGISGLKTSGKDTTAKAIAQALPDLRVRRVAFADKLKELTALTFGYEDELIEIMDDAKENWNLLCFHGDGGDELFTISGRAILQNIGQGARKVFTSNFWVDMVLPAPVPTGFGGNYSGTLEERYPDTDVLCVTDVRYPNEADRVHELGGEIWQIVRPGLESDGHSSEIPLPPDKVDLSIFNGNSIEQLYDVIEEVLAGNVHPQCA